MEDSSYDWADDDFDDDDWPEEPEPEYEPEDENDLNRLVDEDGL